MQPADICVSESVSNQAGAAPSTHAIACPQPIKKAASYETARDRAALLSFKALLSEVLTTT